MLVDNRAGVSTVLFDASTGARVTAGEILAAAEAFRLEFRGSRYLALLLCDGSVAAYRDFLALVEARVPVALIDNATDSEALSRLVEAYSPVVMVDPAHDGSALPRVTGPVGRGAQDIHEDLAVLLTTSGSTGSAKFVRLSADNVKTNAEQIVASLGITAEDRAMAALPLHYSYGMSVVTSHALAGSVLVVNRFSVLQREFWASAREHGVTILPGVPQTYSMLHRLRMPPDDVPTLRAMTQAGGRLAPDLVAHFSQIMVDRGGAFFVMYGQTEASPRIACLPPDRLPEKLGSVGVTLVGGRLVAVDEDGELPAGEVGEIVYSGPNVMMGYAESRGDLALGDVQGSTLRTGDLGYVDDEGFLFLTGRTKRIAKLAGARVSLDEVEAMVADLTHVAAVDAGDAGVAVYTTTSDVVFLSSARRELAHRLHVPPKLLRIEHVEELPLLGNGKVDYRKLTQWAQGGRE